MAARDSRKTRSNTGPIRVCAEVPSVTRKPAFLNHAHLGPKDFSLVLGQLRLALSSDIFSQAVNHLVELLSHMEPIRHGTAVGQPQGARRRISRPHVDPMGADLLALFLREPIQAFQRRRRVSATLHRQDLRPRRVAQIGH